MMSATESVPRSPSRHVTIGRYLGKTAVYGLLFLVCFYIGSFFALSPGGSLWFPAAGLRLATLLIFSWRFTPGLIVAEIAAVALYGALRPHTRYSDPIEVLLVGQTPLIYGIAVFALTRWSPFNSRLRQPRDLVWASSVAVLVPLIAAAESRLVLVLLDHMTPQDFLRSTLGFFIGDTIGILMLTPPLLIAHHRIRRARAPAGADLDGDEEDDEAIDLRRLLVDFLAIWAFLIVLHLLPAWFDQLASNVHWYLAFLPIIWISFRHGFVGSIAGTLAVTSGAAWLAYLPVESIRFHELQILVAFLSVTGLLMGSAISNQARTEKQLARQNRKLRAVQEQLEDKNAELAFSNEELEQFVFAVSHDLKAPLVTIRGFLGYLKKDADAGDVDRVHWDIARIDASAEKMGVLLNDLLDLSRAGRSRPAQAVALGELVHEARELLAENIAARGVDVEVVSDLPVVRGDRARLLQVFQNLLLNAVLYMGDQPSPRVEIGACGKDQDKTVYVRDNGVGIEPRYRDRIFRLFERLDADTNSQGSGVGLALVKRIVDHHGGRIWVESEGRGRGSTFCFTLPQVVEDRLPKA